MALNITQAALARRAKLGKKPLTEKQKVLLEAGEQLSSRSGQKSSGPVPRSIEVPDITPRRRRRDPQDDIG